MFAEIEGFCSTAGECKYVSPWEIEPDPDDLERIERERRMEESKNLALAHEDPTSLFDSQNHPTRYKAMLKPPLTSYLN